MSKQHAGVRSQQSGPAQHGDDALAARAVSYIRPGMVVGLGTGRAAQRCIRELAARAERERLNLTCVATSVASAELARSLKLTVRDMAEVGTLDFLFDGADEVAHDLSMIKGAGGAMTREKLAAAMVRAGITHDQIGISDDTRCIYCIDHTKLVPCLGTHYPLPLEVLPVAIGYIHAVLRDYDMTAVRRMSKDNAAEFAVTDNGNAILDVKLDLPHLEREGIDLDDLTMIFDATPGIVGHGLFLSEADIVLVETPNGLEEMTRPSWSDDADKADEGDDMK